MTSSSDATPSPSRRRARGHHLARELGISQWNLRDWKEHYSSGRNGSTPPATARGASWETFVTEDVIHREKLASPQSQFFFWRTAAGTEIDLVIERGPPRFGFEIKAGSGEKMVHAHKLSAALADVGASHGRVLDKSAGSTPLLPNVECRGFPGAIDWLPETPSAPAPRTKKAGRRG